jgi:hypothetical protein
MLSLTDPVAWSSAAWPYPTRVMIVLTQGRVAERIGDRERAIRAYHHVAAAWSHADPELQPYVAESRAGLKRLRARGRH